jgi:single-strand DNA-binding protein
VEKYVRKGDRIYIEGRIRYTTYDDKQGQRRYATEIWADNMELLGGGSRPATTPQQGATGAQPQTAQSQSAQPQVAAEPQPVEEEPGGVLPF